MTQHSSDILKLTWKGPGISYTPALATCSQIESCLHLMYSCSCAAASHVYRAALLLQSHQCSVARASGVVVGNTVGAQGDSSVHTVCFLSAWKCCGFGLFWFVVVLCARVGGHTCVVVRVWLYACCDDSPVGPCSS